MKRSLLIGVIIVIVAGCVPWIRTGGPYSAPAQNVTVELPDGWMRLNSEDYLLITRDGLMLEYILIERIYVEQNLRNTKKKFRRGMLPQELAGVILDNIDSDQDNLKMKVISNIPQKICGHSGFKSIFTFNNKDGLKYKSIYYGFMSGDYFYGIRYNASQRHYFARELETFKRVVDSLKLSS